MDTVLIGANGATPSSSGTRYQYFPQPSTSSTTDAYRNVVPIAGKLKNFRVDLAVAPGDGKSWVFTIMVSGSATAMEITISNTDTSGTYSATDIDLVAGDFISVRSVPSGTPDGSSLPEFSAIFTSTISGESMILGNSAGNLNSTVNTTKYFAGIQGTGSGSATDAQSGVPMPCSGTLTGWYWMLTAAPGSGKRTLTVRVNGSNTTITNVDVAGATTTGNVTGQSVAVSAGDIVSIADGLGASTANSARLSWGLIFNPTIEGESVQVSGSISALANNSYYNKAGCQAGSWSGTEANFIASLPASCVAKKLYLSAVTRTGTGTIGLLLRKDAGDSTLTVTMADPDTAGNNTANEVSLSAGSVIAMKSTLTGSFSGVMRYGFVTYIAGAAPPASGGSSMMMMGIGS